MKYLKRLLSITVVAYCVRRYYYVCDVTLSVYPHRASLKKYARIEPTTFGFGILAQCSGSGQFEYVYGRHFFKLFYIKAFLYQPKVIVLMRGIDHSPINQNFDLNKSRQTSIIA
jgi:hypothetical protein